MNLSTTLSARDARVACATLVASILTLAGCSGDDDGTNPGSGSTGGTAALPPTGGGATPSVTPPEFQCEARGDGVGAVVVVPEGEFVMGCNEEVDQDCVADERPMRTVFVSEFEINTTEVTQDQYTACVRDGGCTSPYCSWDCDRGDFPASCVTRDQAMMYCAWAGMRLPTEAEWEKAARGTDGRKYPWGNDEPTCDVVNMAGCVNDLSPAGAYPAGASPYGALDMGGNMVEMLADWYDPLYYENAPTENPTGPDNGDIYVGRGGGWKSTPEWHRTSVRDWYAPPDQGASLGFRCAR